MDNRIDTIEKQIIDMELFLKENKDSTIDDYIYHLEKIREEIIIEENIINELRLDNYKQKEKRRNNRRNKRKEKEDLIKLRDKTWWAVRTDEDKLTRDYVSGRKGFAVKIANKKVRKEYRVGNGGNYRKVWNIWNEVF